MMSPGNYVSQFENKPYAELITARESLLADLREQEAAFQSPSAKPYKELCPSSGVVYAMRLQYLAALCSYMARHAQAFTGEPDLYTDGKDDGHLQDRAPGGHLHSPLSRR